MNTQSIRNLYSKRQDATSIRVKVNNELCAMIITRMGWYEIGKTNGGKSTIFLKILVKLYKEKAKTQNTEFVGTDLAILKEEFKNDEQVERITFDLIDSIVPYVPIFILLKQEENRCTRKFEALIKTIPLYKEWGCNINGFATSQRLFGAVLAVAGDLKNYSLPSHLHRRFSTGFTKYGKQKKCKGLSGAESKQFKLLTDTKNKKDFEWTRLRELNDKKNKPIVMGYDGKKRAIIWAAGKSLMQFNKEYRAIYDKRKADGLERGWTKGHAHGCAVEYIGKRFLTNLWIASQEIE